ncbi:MAG: hypothetical protein K5695_02230 [Oscillospiraceae bacterium]|nr:hypothetical protein [Oscillospiraceae bacterium]
MNKKTLAALLTAVLGMTMLTGCGAEPEPLTDETTLLLMEREILRRDHELPPQYIQYHLEHGGLPVEEEESPSVRAVLREVERYLPSGFGDYFSQADQIVQDVGDVMSQAQDVMSRADELTSGAGRDIVDGLISEAGQRLSSAVDEYAGSYADPISEGDASAQEDGCYSMDDAVKSYIAAYYEQDLSNWSSILPDAFKAQNPDFGSAITTEFAASAEEVLPGGMESLSYYVEKDLTAQYAGEAEEGTALRDVYARYGVTDIDGVWLVATNRANGENRTMIVKSGDRYYAARALGIMLEMYGTGAEACYYE